MPGAPGRQNRGRKGQLFVLVGVAGVVVVAGAVAAVAVSGGEEPAEKRAEPTVRAAPPAWTVQAGQRLTSGTGLRYDGTMTVGGRPVQAHLRLTPSGLATGTLTAGPVTANVIAIGGDTYINAGPAFWRDYVTGVAKTEYYAGRWSKAPKSMPGFNVPGVLGPESIARRLAQAPAKPPTETVNGVPAYVVKAQGAEYLMASAPPHRLLSVRAAGPNAPVFTVAPVAAPATVFAELRPRVANLGGAADPGLRFKPGALTFANCDQNTNGCTVSVPATLAEPAGAVPDGARVALRASLSSRGRPLGSCIASQPVPADRSMTLRCTVTSRQWRTWMRQALDNPGAYPYAATAHVVGEAVAEDAVDKLLAKVDKERAAVVPPTPAVPAEPGPSAGRSAAPEVATSQAPGGS
ncbi:hypothetical protein [Actinomadura livida]|uniref:Uncharacterized protein n=1 Tax=Actinomadura livida TaxID=79909 RepID=A0A7W7IJP4_9ACTN|nr:MULTISPECIES: hypothetical protein [Actinomadura]MBB4778304.1 hypothetical protein [Actinomadura catellatispora]GGU25487.1 hypothetical protein GCM10010208_58080 [Actinomadura livida]